MFFDVTNVLCCQIDATKAKWAVRHETVYDIIVRNDYDFFFNLIWIILEFAVPCAPPPAPPTAVVRTYLGVVKKTHLIWK